MIVRTNNGVATLMGPDQVLHSVPYEPLARADLLLQARYHLWTRAEGYRRAWVCTRCKEAMETDTQVNDEDQTWSLLTVCHCRAIYGTIPLSIVRSAMTKSSC